MSLSPLSQGVYTHKRNNALFPRTQPQTLAFQGKNREKGVGPPFLLTPEDQRLQTRRDVLKTLRLSLASGWLAWTVGSGTEAATSEHSFVSGMTMGVSVFGIVMPKSYVMAQTYVNAPKGEKAEDIRQNAFSGIGDVHRFFINMPKNARLQGWYIPPKNGSLAVFSAAAEGDFVKYNPLMKMLADNGYGIFTCQYRGYGIVRTPKGVIISGSTGEPTEDDLYNDLSTLSTRLTQGMRITEINQDGKETGTLSIPEIPFNRQILVGKSIGADLSVRLAAEARHQPYQAIVLITPPISMQAAMKNLLENEASFNARLWARAHNFIFRGQNFALGKLGNMFDIWDLVDKVRIPILFVQAEHDTLAVKEDTKALYEKSNVRNPQAVYLELPNTDHNKTFDDPNNVKRIERELGKLISVP